MRASSEARQQKNTAEKENAGPSPSAAAPLLQLYAYTRGATRDAAPNPNGVATPIKSPSLTGAPPITARASRGEPLESRLALQVRTRRLPSCRSEGAL